MSSKNPTGTLLLPLVVLLLSLGMEDGPLGFVLTIPVALVVVAEPLPFFASAGYGKLAGTGTARRGFLDTAAAAELGSPLGMEKDVGAESAVVLFIATGSTAGGGGFMPAAAAAAMGACGIGGGISAEAETDVDDTCAGTAASGAAGSSS